MDFVLRRYSPPRQPARRGRARGTATASEPTARAVEQLLAEAALLPVPSSDGVGAAPRDLPGSNGQTALPAMSQQPPPSGDTPDLGAQANADTYGSPTQQPQQQQQEPEQQKRTAIGGAGTAPSGEAVLVRQSSSQGQLKLGNPSSLSRLQRYATASTRNWSRVQQEILLHQQHQNLMLQSMMQQRQQRPISQEEQQTAAQQAVPQKQQRPQRHASQQGALKGDSDATKAQKQPRRQQRPAPAQPPGADADADAQRLGPQPEGPAGPQSSDALPQRASRVHPITVPLRRGAQTRNLSLAVEDQATSLPPLGNHGGPAQHPERGSEQLPPLQQQPLDQQPRLPTAPQPRPAEQYRLGKQTKHTAGRPLAAAAGSKMRQAGAAARSDVLHPEPQKLHLLLDPAQRHGDQSQPQPPSALTGVDLQPRAHLPPQEDDEEAKAEAWLNEPGPAQQPQLQPEPQPTGAATPLPEPECVLVPPPRDPRRAAHLQHDYSVGDRIGPAARVEDWARSVVGEVPHDAAAAGHLAGGPALQQGQQDMLAVRGEGGGTSAASGWYQSLPDGALRSQATGVMSQPDAPGGPNGTFAGPLGARASTGPAEAKVPPGMVGSEAGQVRPERPEPTADMATRAPTRTNAPTSGVPITGECTASGVMAVMPAPPGAAPQNGVAGPGIPLGGDGASTVAASTSLALPGPGSMEVGAAGDRGLALPGAGQPPAPAAGTAGRALPAAVAGGDGAVGGAAQGAGRRQSMEIDGGAGQPEAGLADEGAADARGSVRSRRGRNSLEDEMFQAAGALEMLMMGGPAGSSAAAAGVEVTAGVPAASIRKRPSGGGAPQPGIGGRGAGPTVGPGGGGPIIVIHKMPTPGAWSKGGRGRRGGRAGGRGTRVGGSGPLILPSAPRKGADRVADGGDDEPMGAADDAEEEQDGAAAAGTAGVDGAGSRRPGRGVPVGPGPRPVPAPGPGPGASRGGVAPADSTDSGGAAAASGMHAGRVGGATAAGPDAAGRGRPAGELDREAGRPGVGGLGDVADAEEADDAAPAGVAVEDQLPLDEELFGPVPRRPRTSVYCSPLLYEQLMTQRATGQHIPVVLLSTTQLAELLDQQAPAQAEERPLKRRATGPPTLPPPQQQRRGPPLRQSTQPPLQQQHAQRRAQVERLAGAQPPPQQPAIDPPLEQPPMARPVGQGQQPRTRRPRPLSAVDDWDAGLDEGGRGMPPVGAGGLTAAKRASLAAVSQLPPRAAALAADAAVAGDWETVAEILAAHRNIDVYDELGVARGLGAAYGKAHPDALAAAGGGRAHLGPGSDAAALMRMGYQPAAGLGLGVDGGGAGAGGLGSMGLAGLPGRLGGALGGGRGRVGPALEPSDFAGGLAPLQSQLLGLGQHGLDEPLLDGPAYGPPRRRVRRSAPDMLMPPTAMARRLQSPAVSVYDDYGSGQEDGEEAADLGYEELEEAPSGRPVRGGFGGGTDQRPRRGLAGYGGSELDDEALAGLPSGATGRGRAPPSGPARGPALQPARRQQGYAAQPPHGLVGDFDEPPLAAPAAAPGPGPRAGGGRGGRSGRGGRGGVSGRGTPYGSQSRRSSGSMDEDEHDEMLGPPAPARQVPPPLPPPPPAVLPPLTGAAAAAAATALGAPSDQGRMPYDGIDASLAPAATKRPRTAEQGLGGAAGAATVNGRVPAAGAGGRGRQTSPGAAPSAGPGPRGGAPKIATAAAPVGAGAGAAGAVPAEVYPAELAYKPAMEVRDVREEESGRMLALTFLHSTLGTFAGNLSLMQE